MVRHDTQKMRRVLGTWPVTLLGVGALLGGGVFTILGATVGIAGAGGSLLVVILLSFGFIGIVAMYAELGAAFPEAGGGYLWVREGLGDLQGFLSGWLSWFAHAAACALYALSFGFYVSILPGLFGWTFSWPMRIVQILAAVVILAVFGFVNWRGVKTLSAVGNAITLAVLAILVLFAAAGLRQASLDPSRILADFTTILPHGLVGVLAAMSFFFIAFEGSEIQTQAAEEMRNPGRDLPRALFGARVIITVLYLAVTAALIIGFNGGSGSSEAIGRAAEHALPQAAGRLLPSGALLITIGGLLVNVAALNVTIFSSSHVVLAMARARHVLQGLASIHAKNFTPHRAIVLSTVFIIALTILFPIKEVASIADFLFILLFLQATLAFLALRQRRPDVARPFRAPASPALPLATAALLALLGLVLVTHVSVVAGIIGIAWVFFGLLNYYAYSTPMEHAELEEQTIFTHSWKLGRFPTYRVFVPVARDEDMRGMLEIGIALAKGREAADISLVHIDETPGDHRAGREAEHIATEPLLVRLVDRGREEGVGVEGSIIESDDPTRTALGIIAIHRMNLLVAGWDGHARQGRIFSSKVDAMLREARCDTIVVKIADLEHMKRILLCVNPLGGPHLRYLGRVALALATHFSGTVDAVTVLAPDTSREEEAATRDRIRRFLARMELPEVALELVRNADRATGILEREDHYDAIVLGEGKERFLREFRLGSVSHTVMRRSRKTAVMVKGHMGIMPPLWQYLRERL